MPDRPNVVLLQPPYLRLVGSHNDRLPLELCYLNSHLYTAGIQGTVLNADWTGASKYISWRNLFDNSIFLQQAADGLSPLYSECVEAVVSFEPDIVILAAADGLTPWVDLGNAYTTAFLSQELREYGIYTVGVGPFYSAVPKKFISSFDTILVGTASPSIVDIVKHRPQNKIVNGAILGPTALPLLDVKPEIGRDDVVMTAIGCPFDCTFCLARSTKYRQLDLDTVVTDVARRHANYIDFGDSILPLQPSRVRSLARLLSSAGKTFSCEVSINSITAVSLEALNELGVRAVKVGIESGDDKQLADMNKRQTARTILEACRLIKSSGMHLTAYVLLGGPNTSADSIRATYELCRQIEADDYVTNVWSFYDLTDRDFRYDSHWSNVLVREWGLTDTINLFFDLQAPDEKHGLGSLIRMSPNWVQSHTKKAASATAFTGKLVRLGAGIGKVVSFEWLVTITQLLHAHLQE